MIQQQVLSDTHMDGGGVRPTLISNLASAHYKSHLRVSVRLSSGLQTYCSN